ncbi:MAG TPA: arsenate reductase ArsC [Candidatus Dormibacteraeota bacterium]|nr:arsenate reductase ArsC [Candidatus Dormibacteraeota bacterium]
MQKKPKVLFLSRGNATRGQMAEGLLRSLAADRFDATSAGIEPGTLNPIAVEAMWEAGVDISRQQAKNVKELLKEHFAYVITVCDLARERAPIFPFTPNLVHWSIYDPESAQHSAEEKKNMFRRVRDEIRAKVESFLSETTKTKPQLAKTAEAR